MRLTILFPLLLACAFVQAQPGDMPPNPKPGQCYAKCLMAPQYGTTSVNIAVYTGTDSTITQLYTVDTVFVTQPKMQQWVKKKIKGECESDDPNDCHVWRLEATEAKTIRIQRYLLDTAVTKEFISQDRDFIYVTEPGGFTEWVTIVCANRVTKKLVQRVRTALGMEEDTSIRNMNAETKATLVKYQRANGLPIGHLDKESLKHLGVRWPR